MCNVVLQRDRVEIQTRVFEFRIYKTAPSGYITSTMYQQYSSRRLWLVVFCIGFSQLQMLSAPAVDDSTIYPRTIPDNETVYPSTTLTSSSAANTEHITTTANETATSFYTETTSSVSETPSTTSLSINESTTETTTTLEASSTTGTTSTTRITSTTATASSTEITSTTATTSTLGTTSTTATTSTLGTTSTTATTSTLGTTSTTATTSTLGTTSSTQCTTTTTKRPKKDCVIDDADFLDQLRKELINDEGSKEKIYKDSKGNPTFGIGHKITRKDPEFRKRVGRNVTKERIEEAFKADVKAAIESCCKLFKDFQNLPTEVQLIILNMRFNLGNAGLAKFVKFRNAVNRGDWEKAADEMKHSKWYNQVPDRAKRLVEQMTKVGTTC